MVDKMRLAKLRSEWEPNIIAEVLQTTFKDMKSPLLQEAYEAIISMGTNKAVISSFTYIL